MHNAKLNVSHSWPWHMVTANTHCINCCIFHEILLVFNSLCSWKEITFKVLLSLLFWTGLNKTSLNVYYRLKVKIASMNMVSYYINIACAANIIHPYCYPSGIWTPKNSCVVFGTLLNISQSQTIIIIIQDLMYTNQLSWCTTIW